MPFRIAGVDLDIAGAARRVGVVALGDRVPAVDRPLPDVDVGLPVRVGDQRWEAELLLDRGTCALCGREDMPRDLVGDGGDAVVRPRRVVHHRVLALDVRGQRAVDVVAIDIVRGSRRRGERQAHEDGEARGRGDIGVELADPLHEYPAKFLHEVWRAVNESGRPDSNRLPSAWKADVQPVTPRPRVRRELAAVSRAPSGSPGRTAPCRRGRGRRRPRRPATTAPSSPVRSSISRTRTAASAGSSS